MVCTSTSGRLALKQGKTKYNDLTLLNHVKTEPLLSPSLSGEEHYENWHAPMPVFSFQFACSRN